MRTPICHQKFAQHTWDIDTGHARPVSPLKEHLADFSEQRAKPFATKDPIGNAMKQEIAPSQLVQGIKIAEKIGYARNCRLFVPTVLDASDPLFLGPTPRSTGLVRPCHAESRFSDLSDTSR